MALDALPAEFIGTSPQAPGPRPRPVVSQGLFGTKVVATVTGGTFIGPITAAASRSCCGRLGHHARRWRFLLDTRLSFRNETGADIYVTYTGFAKPNGDGTSSIRTAPRLKPATSVTHG